VIAIWNDYFLPGLAPNWLVAFDADPDIAVDELLRGTYNRGFDNVEGPDESLVRWAVDLKLDPSFLEPLDHALKRWLAALAGDNVIPLRRAFAAACRTLLQIPELTEAAGVLRQQILHPRRLLDRLAIDATHHVLDDALMALTIAQPDRSLAAQWWSLVRLDGDVPPARGRTGILGLSEMPPGGDETRGGFRPDLADAVLTLGDALLGRTHAKRLSPQSARDRFVEALRTGLMASPFAEAWAKHIATSSDDLDPEVITWAEASELLPLKIEITNHRSSASRGRYPAQPTPARRQQIEADALRHEAQRLLREERNPERALAVSTYALELDPWSAYSWTIHMRCKFEVAGAEQTVPIAWRAIERFPNNEVCWQELAYFLKGSQRLSLAEEVWYECLERFPMHEQALSNLADLLLDQRRLGEAERLFDRFMSENPSRETLDTQTTFLRLSGRFEKALGIVVPMVQAGTADPYVWGNLIRVLRDSGRRDEAQARLEQARQLFPSDPYFSRFQLDEDVATAVDQHDVSLARPVFPAREAAVLRRRLRRLQEHGVSVANDRSTLQEFVDEHLRGASPGRAVAERSLLHVDGGEVDRAVDELGNALNDLGPSTELLYARARAERTLAREQKMPYSTEAYRKLVEPLAELPVGARPLRALGAVRAASALNNGRPLAKLKFENLAHLDRVTKDFAQPVQGAESAFHSWWRDALRDLMGVDLAQITVADAERAFQFRGREIDGLEEDFVRRLGPALIGR
jgi:tetratricopeptide (TPR) repeat protein